MKTIEKLHLIEDTWRHYIWNYNFFREKLNFNDELNTNYVGVIFGYLHDTIPILKKENAESKNVSLENRFLNSIGILQLIYLQQDLIKELKKSFVLTSKIDFGTNRELRNELIGHPISRRNKSLQSFCLFGYHSNDLGDMTYLKYDKSNNFECEIKGYFTKDIIEKHLIFLNESFDLILDKINLLLSEFKNELILLLNNLDKLDFEILLLEISKNFNYFFESDNVFSKENITKCNNLKNTHLRYNYNVNLFLRNLKSSLIDDINNVNQKYLSNKESEIENEYEDLPSNYSFGKLYDNHPIFGLEYFKKRFSVDKNLIEELNNMENNIGNKFEYYCSYNYLRYLISINHPSFFNE